jgi:Arc/MetJ family transcription regulator
MKMVYARTMSRTNIDLDERLVRRARALTGLKTKRAVVDKALEVLVQTEARKGILKFYGAGVWKGNLKRLRRSRAP